MKVIITGGMSLIAQSLISSLVRDHEIVTTVSNPKSETELKEKLTSLDINPENVKIVTCDFQNFDYENDLLLKEIDLGCDVLVLNACTPIPQYEVLDEHNYETVFKFVDENVKPNTRILQRALTQMKKNRLGRVVFLSTMATEMGLSKYSPYIMAKSCLEGLMKNIAVDYGKYNVYANTVRPGIVRTERTAHLLSDPRYSMKAEKIIPSGTIGKPEQISEVIKLLIQENSYINGETIHVSGGLPLIGSVMRL